MGFLVPVVQMRRWAEAMMVWVSCTSPCLEDEHQSLLYLLLSVAFPLRPGMREEKVSLWFASIMMLGVAESVDQHPLGCLDACVWLQLFPVIGRGTQNLSQESTTKFPEPVLGGLVSSEVSTGHPSCWTPAQLSP